MGPESDTGGALGLRWAADLIGLSLIWFIVGPSIGGTIGLGWGSVGLGVLAVRLSVALGFGFVALSGVLLMRAAGPSPGRPWLVAGTTLAGVAVGAALVTPFVNLVMFVAPPVTLLLLSVGLAVLPDEVGGARPRAWWRVALAAQGALAIGVTLFLVVGPSHLGFRRASFMPSGFSIRVGGQLWASDSARGAVVATTMMAVALAALLLVLTAVTLTRRWAQGQVDAARPLEGRPAPGVGGAPTTSPRPPAPAVATSGVVEEPRWDPAETDGAWETVRPRPDDDLLRP